MTVDQAIHITRNPHGHSDHDYRAARLLVCEELDRLRNVERETAETCIKLMGNLYPWLVHAIKTRFEL